MKYGTAATLLACAWLITAAILIPPGKPKPPAFVAPTALCEITETDGDMITPEYQDERRHYHPPQLLIMGEIRVPGANVPCIWLNRKPNV